MIYTLPRNVYSLLEEAFHDKEKSEIFARAIEESIKGIDDKATELINNKKEDIQNKIYGRLRNELATKEFVRAEIGELDKKISNIDTRLSMLEKILWFIVVGIIGLLIKSFILPVASS